MESESGSPTKAHGPLRGLVLSCAVLLALLVPCGALVAWLVAGKVDNATAGAATLAVGICWIAGVLALITTYLGRRLAAPVQGVLGGMLFRMGLPMAVGFVLHRQGGQLAQAGVFTMILGVYLFALLVETLFSLWLMPPAASVGSSLPTVKSDSITKATSSA